jgi:3-methyl-2-oxobutanoate hydroxymethyltransferase
MKSKINKLMKLKGKSPIVCLTSYSKTLSEIIDKYCDLILVGDSVANVLYGMKNTHKVTLDMIINHAISVRLGTKKSLMVVDMPKNTYNNKIQAKKNALKIITKTKCDAIKIESNKKNYSIIHYLSNSGIHVMGHIGYTPQNKKKFKVEGISKRDEIKLLMEAKEIEKAGAFSIVLECIAGKTSKKITKQLKIPTIGIGSSQHCDGQILVTDDMLGLSGFYPKFVKKYVEINKVIDNSVQKYRNEVKKRKFPRSTNSY